MLDDANLWKRVRGTHEAWLLANEAAAAEPNG